MTLAEINTLDRGEFVERLGGIIEHSPWIANAAWPSRPFASVDALHTAIVAALMAAPIETQIVVIRAHPELARLSALNRAYKAKFGFPFIIAVKGLDRAAIIERFAARLEHDRATEFAEALAQIARISRLRLAMMLES